MFEAPKMNIMQFGEEDVVAVSGGNEGGITLPPDEEGFE